MTIRHLLLIGAAILYASGTASAKKKTDHLTYSTTSTVNLPTKKNNTNQNGKTKSIPKAKTGRSQ